MTLAQTFYAHELNPMGFLESTLHAIEGLRLWGLDPEPVSSAGIRFVREAVRPSNLRELLRLGGFRGTLVERFAKSTGV